MRAASTAAELAAADVDYLDAMLAQHGVGDDVAFVAHYHAGRHGQEIGAVVPLLTLGGSDVLVGGEHGDLGHLEDLGQGVPQALVSHDGQLARGVAGRDRPAPQVAVKVGVEDEGPRVDHGHNRVEVHEGMAMRQFDGDDLGGLAVIEQGTGHRFDRHRRGALPHAHQDCLVANYLHIAAFYAGRLVVDVLGPVVGDEIGAGEERMEAVEARVWSDSRRRAGIAMGLMLTPP